MTRIVYTNSSSKKKQNKKPGWQEREAEYRKWLMKNGIDPDAPKKKKAFVPYKPAPAYRRETPQYPSLSSTVGNGTTPVQKKNVYTGDYIVGIATMHKSNIVPVSREQDGKDYSTMRRN